MSYFIAQFHIHNIVSQVESVWVSWESNSKLEILYGFYYINCMMFRCYYC